MTLIIEKWDLHPLHLSYHRPLRWASMEEDGADFLLLVLHSKDGHTGVAEASVRVEWAGVNLAALMVVLNEIFLPRLKGVDISDLVATDRIISRIPEQSLAKSVVDSACWDMRAEAAGTPLWQYLGGRQEVPVSWILTRQAPEIMAEEAGQITGDHGIRTLKLKTGQGLEKDRKMLRLVRETVGEDVQLYADANSYYDPEDIVPYTELLTEAGCVMSEDPCTIMPDDTGRLVCEASIVPIMIDKHCRNYFQAQTYLKWGAAAISVKYSKSGISESLLILDQADSAGAQAPLGLSANSSFGSLSTLSLAATRSPTDNLLPAEESFFLQLRDDYITEPLRIADGVITLPDTAGAAVLVDWDKVRAYSAAP
ncbi:MAG: mandelate racemase/muconate lactonizing enzyme family protein [Proteobacteria bacterium]|nr:mandelate racemase/muconate lactonizing enzyme family protein [Pseudomonadota bacterium]